MFYLLNSLTIPFYLGKTPLRFIVITSNLTNWLEILKINTCEPSAMTYCDILIISLYHSETFT